MVFRSFVLYGSSLRIPTPQGIGTGGEVGTPAALVAQRPNDDAGMVLGTLKHVPRTVEELISPGLGQISRSRVGSKGWVLGVFGRFRVSGPVTSQQRNGQILHKAVCFNVGLVHYIEAIFITEFIPTGMMRVMRVSHCIEVAFLPQMPTRCKLQGS